MLLLLLGAPPHPRTHKNIKIPINREYLQFFPQNGLTSLDHALATSTSANS
jgi:hypothetical protein